MAKEVTKRMNKGLDHTRISFKNQKSEIKNQKWFWKIRKNKNQPVGSRKTIRGIVRTSSENRTQRTAVSAVEDGAFMDKFRGAGFSEVSSWLEGTADWTIWSWFKSAGEDIVTRKFNRQRQAGQSKRKLKGRVKIKTGWIGKNHNLNVIMEF